MEISPLPMVSFSSLSPVPCALSPPACGHSVSGYEGAARPALSYGTSRGRRDLALLNRRIEGKRRSSFRGKSSCVGRMNEMGGEHLDGGRSRLRCCMRMTGNRLGAPPRNHRDALFYLFRPRAFASLEPC